MALGGRMHRAAVHRRQHAPCRVMDVGRLHVGRQALRIGHRGKVAVIGVADPARARQVGAIFAGAAAAQHRLAGRGDEVGVEAFAFRRETFAVEFRIGLRAGAKSVAGKSLLMRIDEGHAVGARIAADDAGLAQRQRLQLRQEFIFDIAGDIGEPLRVGIERGMDVEAGAVRRGRARRHWQAPDWRRR